MKLKPISALDRAYPDTVVGGDIRAVAADVSPWQDPPHPANGHRLTSAATVGGSSGDENHDEKMRPTRHGADTRD